MAYDHGTRHLTTHTHAPHQHLPRRTPNHHSPPSASETSMSFTPSSAPPLPFDPRLPGPSSSLPRSRPRSLPPRPRESLLLRGNRLSIQASTIAPISDDSLYSWSCGLSSRPPGQGRCVKVFKNKKRWEFDYTSHVFLTLSLRLVLANRTPSCLSKQVSSFGPLGCAGNVNYTGVGLRQLFFLYAKHCIHTVMLFSRRTSTKRTRFPAGSCVQRTPHTDDKLGCTPYSTIKRKNGTNAASGLSHNNALSEPKARHALSLLGLALHRKTPYSRHPSINNPRFS